MSGCLAENTLVEFVEGGLSPDATDALHQHVDGCAECRRLLAEVAGTLSLSLPARPSPRSTPSARSWSLRVTEASNLGPLGRARDPAPRVREVRLETGDRVGNYRVARCIGMGGMGAVFEAVHEQIRSRVAIKVLYPHYSENPETVARFLNEARAVNIVRHPSIVQSFEVGHLNGGAAAGSAYLVMEYLDGESLAARLKRLSGPLGPDTLRISRQVASALCAAHAWGVIHRDLTPGNVMLVPDPEMAGGERVKILDFGLAKIAAEIEDLDARGERGYATYDGTILGTPAYMAPEQCQSADTVDEKADVYSLGVVLYECLSGRLPFQAKGAVDLMAMHIYVAPPPLAEEAADVDPALCALVQAMLAKDPTQRPPMEEVAAELDRLDGMIDLPQKVSTVPPGVSTGRFGAARIAARAEALAREEEQGEAAERPRTAPPLSAAPPPPLRAGRRLATGLVVGLALFGVFSLGRAVVTARPLSGFSVMDGLRNGSGSSTQIVQRALAAPHADLTPPLAAPPSVPVPAPPPDTVVPPRTSPPQRTRPHRTVHAPVARPHVPTAPGPAAAVPAAPAPAPEWTDEKIKIFK